MPQRVKPTPVRHCEHCAKLLMRIRFPSGRLESLSNFGRRKYCNRACMAAAFDARPSGSVDWSTSHYHARKLVPPGPCETCGAPDAMDVHHKDGMHTNNSRDNLERICRSCHMRHHRPRTSCTICGKPVKGHGFCDKHYQRFRKHGDPHAIKANQHRGVQFAD